MSTQAKLTQALQALKPSYLQLENESHQHAGYFDGKESHFKLTIVSQAFENLRLIARHQKIYTIAHDFLTAQGGSIHALAIYAYTPDEWQTTLTTPDSPLCASQRQNH